MKYQQLLQKLTDGTITETDLAGVSAESWLEVRKEYGNGLLHYALTDAFGMGGADEEEEEMGGGRPDEDEEEMGRKKKEPRQYSYVMVSDELIPPLGDKVMANAWDVREFKYRGSNVLYDHNIQESRPPIGQAANLKKGVELKRGGKNFKALTGDVAFADRSVYAFAGLVEDLVDAKLLSNGSVGFDVMKMRPPTEDEQQEMGMKAYSAVIQKANLIEFSITPLGRDKNARLLSADGEDLMEAKLAEFARLGVHDDEVLGQFRESLSVTAGESTRSTFTVPEMPQEDEAASGDADEAVLLQLTALKEEVAALREELRTRPVEDAEAPAEAGLYDALYELAVEPQDHPEPDSGDGSRDIYSLARELGF